MTYFIPNYTIPASAMGVRPAAMGSGCDAYCVNPNFDPEGDEPRLIKCKAEAVYTVTIRDAAGFLQRKKQCAVCLEILQQKPLIEVLNVEQI